MKPAANLSLLWPELPYLDRFDAAAAAGFAHVEVLFPYEFPVQETRRALMKNGQALVLFNAPPPNYTGGSRGFAANPDLVKRFQSDMRRAFRYAGELKTPMIHVMAGPGEGDLAKKTMIENLIWAAAEAPKGLTLMIEPLCPEAMEGYFLNDYALAGEILTAVNAPNVALQYDSYHAQMIHGDAVAVFQKYCAQIRHAQLGDAPKRVAPGQGAVDFTELFAAMRENEYEGFVSGEYHPNGPTEDTLGWMDLR